LWYHKGALKKKPRTHHRHHGLKGGSRGRKDGKKKKVFANQTDAKEKNFSL